MNRLSVGDRQILVRLLAAQPMMQNFRGRRQLLELAGLDQVATQIDLEGAPLISAGEIVHVLDVYGRLPHGPAALGLFLNAVKETIGGGDSAVAVIDRVLLDYQLMTPVKTTDFSIPWVGAQGVDEVRERVIGENTLRHVAFLERGLCSARSVAFVHAGAWTGTAFLLAPSLVITNNHVLPTRGVAQSAVFRFNYQ